MKVVASSCLLGFKTRYDGRDKKHDFGGIPADVEYLPFCPEVEAGLGVPREPIELVRMDDGSIHVLGRQTREDFTDRIEACCRAKVAELKRDGVDCFVLKSNSPSCGLESPLHDACGNVVGTAPGVWARIVATEFPGVPHGMP